MVSISTGLYLWWPGITGLCEALKICHHAGMMRFFFDLHRITGLFSAAPLLLLAVTGFLLSYPDVLESLTGSSGMQHGETGRTIASTAIPNNHPAGLAAASFVAQGPFPKAELRRVTTPAGETGIYRINLRQGFEINRKHPYTTVWVDRWSGQIKEVRNPTQFSKSETAATWIWPLHTGEALGASGRLVWFLAGQSLFFLYVSGLLRWLYRCGKISDRNVNFAALKPFFHRLAAMSYRLGLAFFHLMVFFVRRAKQFAPIGYAALSYRLPRIYAMLSNRQKRIGKSN